jgi:hypothetical protein
MFALTIAPWWKHEVTRIGWMTPVILSATFTARNIAPHDSARINKAAPNIGRI